MSDRLKNLTKNEITVLYWKCKGLKYEQIAARLGYSKDWVQVQASNVYTKLGFEKTMHWTKRAEILEKEICPLLPKDLKDWKPTEEIPASIEPKTEPKADPEMLALVLYDEKQLEEIKNKAITPPRQEVIVIGEPTKGVKTFRRILFTIVSILIIFAVGYVAFRAGRGATPAPVFVVVTATPIPATETPLATDTPVFTETPLPTFTFTPLPTNTPLPTATPFVPPEDGILFQDDFESGDLSAWTQSSGQWLVSEGKLTKLVYHNSSDYQWISINRPEWKNYILSVDVNKPYSSNDFVIAVRNNTSNPQLIGLHVNGGEEINLSLIANNENDNSLISAASRIDIPYDINVNIQLTVDGDTYILKVNDREVQRITFAGYDSGGISIGAYCTSQQAGCTTFDNIKVTYLP